ncbi:helix-turn-helix transcriptional regulator [Streptomyces flaveolus]|uniref:helix-turn-helix domain-containing protein n=1 Tax=Streptomyces flaveolus TaxID=67297 RepID=UPI0006721A8B|nr:helix-turn-helix transcriptional regulator [Streptomyces antibioticus]KMS85105.1 DNA-binding protein [Streptomyces regensis]KOG61491.1 DNA-binding protein [Streptomyces antibioticus]
MSNPLSEEARVVPLRPDPVRPEAPDGEAAPREPLWRDLVGEVLRRERQAQERTLKDVADAARISLPYLSEVERGRKEASSEVLAAAAHALGLGLGDLLSLAHGELIRRTAERHRPAVVPRRPATAPSRAATAPHRPYQGLCLAA